MTAAAEAKRVAKELLEALGPACEQLVVAGSLRRGAAEVKDIELVAVPRVGVDLFGAPNGVCELGRALEREVAIGRLRWRTETHPAGERGIGAARRAWYLVALPGEVRIDLFAVRPPAQWGAILAIRTGPAEYSRQLVTVCQRRGLRCTEGHLVNARGELVPTPTERAFIEACGLPWREPRDRGVR